MQNANVIDGDFDATLRRTPGPITWDLPLQVPVKPAGRATEPDGQRQWKREAPRRRAWAASNKAARQQPMRKMRTLHASPYACEGNTKRNNPCIGRAVAQRITHGCLLLFWAQIGDVHMKRTTALAMRGIMEDKHCLEHARVKAEGRVIRRCAATRSPLLLNLEAVRAGACVISNATLVPQARHAYAFTRHQTPVRSSARPLNVARATYKANRIIMHARTCASRTQKHLPHSTRCAALRERAGNLRTQGPL